MPVITFNKKYLYGLLGAGIDDHKLSEQATKLGLEIESIDDENVALEVTANRMDLLDAVGFARALRNFMHKSKNFYHNIEDSEPALEIAVDPNVKKIRPYVAGVVALGLKLDNESLQNLINFTEKFCETYGRSRKKIAIGLHNFDEIKPPVIFKCEEDIEYVPLGGMSKQRLSAVLEQSDKGKRYSHIIKKGKGAIYPVIEDAEGVASFVPILNSDRTKVTTSTKNIFVDITGTSEYAVNKAADLIGASLMDMGAKIKRVRINYGKKQTNTPEMEEWYISIPLAKAEREIGVEVGFDNIISLSNKMGYEAGLKGKNIVLRVPEYRLDVIDQQDVIEDIAIGYGYEYIKPEAVYYSQPGALEPRTKAIRRISEIMVGLGFSEFANSYLTNEDSNFRKMGVEAKDNAVLLKDSKTETITMMRTWLLPSLLNNLSMSAHEKMPQNVFEVDMVFLVHEGKAEEADHAAAISVDPRANFNDIKAVVEGFMDAAGIEYEIAEHKQKSFIEGRCAEINIGGKRVGLFGELHPAVLKNFGIEEPAVAFEIDIGKFYTQKQSLF